MKTVLVVDQDNQEVANLVRDILLQAGYDVTLATDSLKAWHMIDNNQVMCHAVVAGGRSGLDLLIRISATSRLRDTKLVSMSGFDLSQTCEQIGAHFIKKPFDHEVLLEALQ